MIKSEKVVIAVKIISVKIGFLLTTLACLLLSVVLWTKLTHISFGYTSDNIGEMGDVKELLADELIKLSLEQLMSIEVVTI